MGDIELKRGYEVLPDNDVRFGIRVINVSDSAISEVKVILDYNASLFELAGSEVQKLDTIPPAGERTAQFILKPRCCIHKEEITATVRYKDHQWNRHSVEMRPKEVHCVCPFLKEKPITRTDFLALAASGHIEERGINFEAITIDKLIAFLLHTCQNRLYRVDDVSVEQGRILYLAADAIGEKAYYLLTVVVVEQEDVIQVLLRASSDKRHGLTGFLNELMENLRHLISSVAHAREIGVIKQEQVINIIDSVVQRTTFAAAGGGETPSVTIKDSVVQRTEIKADEAARRRQREEEERLRREQEERTCKAQKEAEKSEREKHEWLRRDAGGNMRGIKVADETWIGCALLHLEYPERVDFTVMEIVQRVAQENIHGELRPGINWHANLHCVANKTPNPGNYRMLYETQKGRRRLFRDGDTYHPLREGKKTKPSPSKIPPKYHYLLNWYEEVYNKVPKTTKAELTTQEKEEQEREKAEQDHLHKEEEKKEQKKKAREDAEIRKREQEQQKTFTNSIGMKFTLIPSGEFEMGSKEIKAAQPVHNVTIKNPFYLGTYPVTQREWKAVMGRNPSRFKSLFKGDNRPVENVSWDDVQEFIRKLNAKEGTNKYRRSSEAEWEYACRAGTTTRYSFGDSDSKLGEYAWYDGNSSYGTHPVGQKKPNPWGLYDMYGNVFEWVQDHRHRNYNGAPTDGSAWEGSGVDRVLRGGSWNRSTGDCRAASRDYDAQGVRGINLGFRLARDV